MITLHRSGLGWKVVSAITLFLVLRHRDFLVTKYNVFWDNLIVPRKASYNTFINCWVYYFLFFFFAK